MNDRLSAIRLLVIALVAFVALGDGSAASFADTAATVLSGKITSVDTGEPIVGAQVKFKRVGTTTTNGKGRYRLKVNDAAGVVAVVVKAAGHVRRNTWVTIGDSTRRVRTSWDLMPQASDRFDAGFFDAMARDRDATTRWAEAPRFRVIENRIDCEIGGPLACQGWRVSNFEITSSVLPAVSIAMQSASALTGGLVTDISQFELVLLQPGILIQSEDILAPGTFTFAEILTGFRPIELPAVMGSTTLQSQALLMAADAPLGQAALNQFVARGLGFVGQLRPATIDACNALQGRGVLSVLCPNHGLFAPTDFDAAIGRALYSRPVGNRRPDRDPRPE